MTIDTSREAVERLAHIMIPMPGVRDTLTALLARAEAAEAEVARLSTPPDDAEVAVLEGWLRNPWSKATPGTERGPIPEWVYALLHQAADALTRLSHAHAAEKAKRADNLFHWCSSCRSVGMVHCAHPDECGGMISLTRDELGEALAAHAARRKPLTKGCIHTTPCTCGDPE